MRWLTCGDVDGGEGQVEGVYGGAGLELDVFGQVQVESDPFLSTLY